MPNFKWQQKCQKLTDKDQLRIYPVAGQSYESLSVQINSKNHKDISRI
jgi:hypothetical protein